MCAICPAFGRSSRRWRSGVSGAISSAPDLWWLAVDEEDVPEDVRWVAESPHISMLAIPDTPAASHDGQMATAWLTHEAVGGTVDHSLNGPG
jgi:hypothetical protein